MVLLNKLTNSHVHCFLLERLNVNECRVAVWTYVDDKYKQIAIRKHWSLSSINRIIYYHYQW